MDLTVVGISSTNFIALGVLIYRLGAYKKGIEDRIESIDERIDSKIAEVEKSVMKIQQDYHNHVTYDAQADQRIMDTQTRHGESLARVEITTKATNEEVSVLRSRLNNYLDRRPE